jgi:hypothetical protein
LTWSRMSLISGKISFQYMSVTMFLGDISIKSIDE